jgi:hypothetical protein
MSDLVTLDYQPLSADSGTPKVLSWVQTHAILDTQWKKITVLSLFLLISI